MAGKKRRKTNEQDEAAPANPKSKRKISSSQEEDTQFSDGEDFASQASQATVSKQATAAFQQLNDKEKKSKMAEMVRAIIFRHTKGKTIAFADLREIMKPNTQATQPVFALARKELREVFGFDLIQLPPNEPPGAPPVPLLQTPSEEQRKTNQFFLTNILPQANDSNHIDWGHESEKLGLLMVILGLIYCSNLETSESKLWHSLKRLGIAKRKKHPKFGNVEQFIEKDLVAQKYLVRIKKDDPDYRWGPRARAEYTERDILSFLAEIYGENVEDWLERLGKDDASLASLASQASQA